jgi:hypothetical protein
MELLLLSIICLETESGRGIWCENQAGVEFSNNTIASTNGNGDYGIHVSNLSAPIIKNNIIDNFQNGIYADNTIANYAIQYNDTWSISGTEYSGGALPPLIGNYIGLNNNGDASDIYGNISLDPLFDANAANPYSLQLSSPCIHAGDPNVLDPDTTISDMGAFYYPNAPVNNTTVTQPTYNVSGNAYLSDVLPTSTGHDSITIYFIDLIQQDTVATSLTDTYGAYTASIPAGFYLIKWEKYAYIPQELGNYALSSDTTFI